ncbi:magnesium transporter CorA family protein [Candidatus Campbellbacteria bacterium]|nr:MAG: magnesium transporter CorA family protein [Candidatus Campbellbacteria bacterium]
MTLTTHTHKKLTWIDVVSPTRDDVATLIEHYHIPALVGAELLVSTRRSHSDMYDSCAYIVLHFPKKEHNDNGKSLHEIDFIIMPDVLITARYTSDTSLQEFKELFDTNNATATSLSEIRDVGSLVHTMIEKLYLSFEYDLERIGKSLERIEEKIFADQEKKVVHSLSLLGRELADFKKALGYHEEAFEEIATSGQTLLGESFNRHIRSSIGDYRRIRHQLEGEESFFNELRETNNSLLSIKQNEVIKTLTVMAFITFPLTLVAGIFGMNTIHAPFVGSTYDFWIIIVLMAILSISMYSFFKHKRWL